MPGQIYTTEIPVKRLEVMEYVTSLADAYQNIQIIQV
jgi:hypothetical protein